MRRKIEPVTILIDEEDYDRLEGRKVSIGSHGYAQIWNIELKRVMLLHRWIMGATDRTYYSFVCDHVNRNKLDNRKENLRIVSPTDSNDNRMERPRLHDLPKHISMNHFNFMVSFKRNLKIHYVGTYRSVEEAVKARDEWIESHVKTDDGYALKEPNYHIS